ncbi:MAG: prephenate dehydratase [Micavibrio sp.]|nr:prephenate dehydratase [Micavibrio sp.]|tara:strand:+ start:129 stop:965 length:837 start_codon:yes stop_codon:yes gene_type:complete
MTQKIAFQGCHGAYHEQAALEVYPNAQTLPCETFEETFDAAQNNEADMAIIATDNTLAGRVADVHRLLPQSGLHIIGETFLPIHHALIGLKGATIEGLTDVHSHVHALPQCSKIIQELKLKKHVRADTAGSAQDVLKMNDPSQAAIASKLAAEIYGLEVLKADIEDVSHNTTRFIFLSKEAYVPEYDKNKTYITSFLFEVRNIPAALFKSLSGFATNGINMVKLESYVDEKLQAAQFYADVMGHPEERSLQLAMEELGFFAKDVLLMGTYEAHEFRSK